MSGCRLLAIAGLVLAALPADAAVIYDFTARDSAGVIGFTWQSPDFVTAATAVDGSDFSRCTLPRPFGECFLASFEPDYLQGYQRLRLSWGWGPTLEWTDIQLYSNSFAIPGAWRDTRAGNAVLTVTESTVPEPAGWALLITGFGLSGAAMRRRRLAAG